MKKYVIKCAFYAALANDVFKEKAGVKAASVFSNEGMAGRESKGCGLGYSETGGVG